MSDKKRLKLKLTQHFIIIILERRAIQRHLKDTVHWKLTYVPQLSLKELQNDRRQSPSSLSVHDKFLYLRVGEFTKHVREIWLFRWSYSIQQLPLNVKRQRGTFQNVNVKARVTFSTIKATVDQKWRCFFPTNGITIFLRKLHLILLKQIFHVSSFVLSRDSSYRKPEIQNDLPKVKLSCYFFTKTLAKNP